MNMSIERRAARLLLSPPWALIVAPFLALLLLLIIRALLQVSANAAQLRARDLGDESHIIMDPLYGPFCLRIQLPRTLQLSKPEGGGIAGAVSLHAVTIDMTSSMSTTVACGSVQRPLSSSTPLTNSGLISYVVIITAPATVALIDEKNHPHPGRYIFGANFAPRTEPTLFLRQAAPRFTGFTETLGIRVEAADGQPLTKAIPVPLTLEGMVMAPWRYFVDGTSTLDMLAIWLALLPLVLGFLIKQLQSKQETSERLQQENAARAKQEIERSVQKLTDLRRTNLMAFVDEALRLEQATEFPWDSDEARTQLRLAQQTLAEPSLQAFMQLTRWHRLCEDDEKFFRQVLSELNAAEIAQALEWVYIDNPYEPAAHETAVRLATRLRTAVDCNYLHEYMRHEHWASLLLAWPSFTFWRERPGSFNIRLSGADPFSANRAEDDPVFFPPEDNLAAPGTSKVRPLLWRRRPPRLRRQVYRTLLTDTATLVIAPPGSGKTAAAFLTAYELLVFQRTQKNTLPVYWPLSAANISLQGQWLSFATSQAKTLAAYVGASPQSFFDASPRHQNAIARLLASCFGAGRNLENLFYQLHLRNTDALARLFEQLHRHTKDMSDQVQSRLLDSEQLLQLISNAQPQPIQKFLLLLDVQADNMAGQQGPFTATLSKVTERLLHLGFSIDAFLPFDPGGTLREQFTDLIPFEGAKGKSFRWSDGELLQLLENRLLLIDDTQGGSLQTLVDADYSIVERLTGEIIQKSEGRPGRLLAMGRRLVRRCAAAGGRVPAAAVREILEEMDQFQ